VVVPSEAGSASIQATMNSRNKKKATRIYKKAARKTAGITAKKAAQEITLRLLTLETASTSRLFAHVHL